MRLAGFSPMTAPPCLISQRTGRTGFSHGHYSGGAWLLYLIPFRLMVEEFQGCSRSDDEIPLPRSC